MTIDIETESLVHFPAAARTFPGRAVCLQTLHRWRLRGVRGVKLETVVVGGLRYTSREAIRRFVEAQNADEPPDLTPSAARRAKQSQAAREQLGELGV